MSSVAGYHMRFYREFFGDVNWPEVPVVGEFGAAKAQLSQALLARYNDPKVAGDVKPKKAALLDQNKIVVANIEITVDRTGFVTQDIP